MLEPGKHNSIEQSLHLAGYGPECVRKACVDETLTDKALGHDIKGADDVVVELLLALDPFASRYDFASHEQALPAWVEHWRVECRYLRTGDPSIDATAVEDVVREARMFVDRCVAELWSDGVLTLEGLQ